MGPMAAPAPASPAHTPMARPRSWGGKTVTRIDRVAGMTSAAPTPMIPRVMTTWLAESDTAASTEAAPKTTRPMVRAPLRPKRSPKAPPVSRSPAKTSA